MNFKLGVKIQGIKPEMCLAIFEAQRVFDEYKAPLTITSVIDGKHSARSKHKLGYAIDIRTRNVPSKNDLEDITRLISSALGDEYFVLLEDDHIHIQFNGSDLI